MYTQHVYKCESDIKFPALEDLGKGYRRFIYFLLHLNTV